MDKLLITEPSSVPPPASPYLISQPPTPTAASQTEDKKRVIEALVGYHRLTEKYEELVIKLSLEQCDAEEKRMIESLEVVKFEAAEFERGMILQTGGERTTTELLQYVTDGKRMMQQYISNVEKALEKKKKKKVRDLENKKKEKEDLEKENGVEKKEKEGGHGQKKEKKNKQKKQKKKKQKQKQPSPTNLIAENEPIHQQEQLSPTNLIAENEPIHQQKQPPVEDVSNSSASSSTEPSFGVVSKELGILKRLTDQYEVLVNRLASFGSWDVGRNNVLGNMKKVLCGFQRGGNQLADVVEAQKWVHQQIVQAEKDLKTVEKKKKQKEYKKKEKEENKKKKKEEEKKKKKEKEDLEKEKEKEEEEEEEEKEEKKKKKKKEKEVGQEKHRKKK